MTLVSTKEFNTHQDKYLDLAVNEEVCIKRGDALFYLMYRPLEVQYPEQVIKKPDDDLRNAITAEELIKRIHEDKRRNFANCI